MSNYTIVFQQFEFPRRDSAVVAPVPLSFELVTPFYMWDSTDVPGQNALVGNVFSSQR
jgi:hypothetical protein